MTIVCVCNVFLFNQMDRYNLRNVYYLLSYSRTLEYLQYSIFCYSSFICEIRMNESIKHLLLSWGMWFISSLIRVLHNYHKTWVWSWKKSIIRVVIGTVLSYFASLRLPTEILVRWLDLRWPSIFLIWFFGVEVLDFIESKDVSFFIGLFTKYKNAK